MRTHQTGNLFKQIKEWRLKGEKGEIFVGDVHEGILGARASNLEDIHRIFRAIQGDTPMDIPQNFPQNILE